MSEADLDREADALRPAVTPITGAYDDFDPLMDRIGNASIVLLGEATHGTHEFYRARADITRRLILEKGFDAVAVEADWPDAYRVNRFVQGRGRDTTPEEALTDFIRFPTWMWRNAEIVEFIHWLHQHNLDQPEQERVGFYGLDLYSLHNSINAVLAYLDTVDPAAAERARQRYACFDLNADPLADPHHYGYATARGARPDCQREAVQQLIDLQRRAAEYVRLNGMTAADEQFFAERNARVVIDAEQYYRTLFTGRANSWNLRDEHMADTLTTLSQHLQRTRGSGRVVVWAHNSHIGDARATEMTHRGEHNLGQLARQQHGDNAVLVGFTTYQGTVSAASDWGEPVERKHVRRALPASCESLFHHIGHDAFVMRTDHDTVADIFDAPRLQRMIGVIYRPETERHSHYVHCRLAEQFDAVVHFDHTHAVEPMELTALWQRGEAPETFPTGL